MVIKVQRFGGVAGIQRPPVVVDTATMGSGAGALEDLVHRSKFFELPKEVLPEHPIRDGFQYEITVQDGDRKHTVTTTDAAASADLRALLHSCRRA